MIQMPNIIRSTQDYISIIKCIGRMKRVSWKGIVDEKEDSDGIYRPTI